MNGRKSRMKQREIVLKGGDGDAGGNGDAFRMGQAVEGHGALSEPQEALSRKTG